MIEVKDVVFLFSNDRPNPKYFFQGYCFFGRDYIYGELGGEQFYEKNKVGIPSGEDGCYVSVIEDEGIYHFSNDHHGYKKIFYIWDDGKWAVSNSIYKIVQWMRSSGLEPRPNYPQLLAASTPGMMFQQPFSFENIVEDIKLLPAGYSLRIGSSQYPSLEAVPSVKSEGTYQENLAEYLELWVSRIETLLREPDFYVSSDLTGGVDSRSILAMFLKAQSRLGEERKLAPKFNCGSIAGDKKDLEIATLLSQEYGLRLNSKVDEPRQRYSLSEAFSTWMSLSLGAYHPIYFPKYKPISNLVQFGGGGGGIHRDVYDLNKEFENVDDYINSLVQDITPRWLQYDLSRSIKQAFELLGQNKQLSYRSLLMAHYRHFRNRFHAGRAPQMAVVFPPLGSRFLDSTSTLLADELRVSAQVNYDIMASLEPSLLDFPYDKETKKPNNLARKNLTSVEISEVANPGSVYGVVSQPANLEGPTEAELLDQLSMYLDSVVKNPFVVDFWGKAFIEDARKTVKEAVHQGRLRHAVDGIPISNIVLSSLFFEADENSI